MQPPLNRDALLSVLAQTNKTIQLGSQLSKSTNKGTNSAYIQDLCDTPISLTEIKKFVAAQPDAFYVFQSKLRKAIGSIAILNNVVHGTVEPTLVLTPLDDGQRVTFVEHSIEAKLYRRLAQDHFQFSSASPTVALRSADFNNIYQLLRYPATDVDITMILLRLEQYLRNVPYPNLHEKLLPKFEGDFELDFASQYHIYNSRLGCTTRMPGYARAKILQQLTFLKQQMDTDITGLVFAYVRLFFELQTINQTVNDNGYRINDQIFYNYSTSPNPYRPTYTTYQRLKTEADRWFAVIYSHYDLMS